MAKPQVSAGSPALMMTFFVLLYSFSSIDETKYKMIVQSMADGFGAVLATPNRPTTISIGPTSMMPSPMSRSARPSMAPTQSAAQQSQQLMEDLQEGLQSELAEGVISMETSGNRVVIRFPEEIAFPPGSDALSDEIVPILRRVSVKLAEAPGNIMVAGHTDDRPIKSAEFASNWELSTDRAVAVVHRMLELSDIPPNRLQVVGYGDTRPIAPNDTPENRARNRRVEIIVVREIDGAS
jgi:chemotaxis protein MotB